MKRIDWFEFDTATNDREILIEFVNKQMSFKDFVKWFSSDKKYYKEQLVEIAKMKKKKVENVRRSARRWLIKREENIWDWGWITQQHFERKEKQ